MSGSGSDILLIQDIEPSNSRAQLSHAKMTSAKLYIYIGVGARDMYIDEAHMALDTFSFTEFFFLRAHKRENQDLYSPVLSEECNILPLQESFPPTMKLKPGTY